MAESLQTGNRVESPQSAKGAAYWQAHYVLESDPNDIARRLAWQQ